MLDYKRAKGSPSPCLSNQQPIPKSGFSPGLPNSALLPAAAPADSGLDEKMRLRLPALLGQNPAAEAEADRLSQGVQASTPEEVKPEMGRRLGADLSGVRLHTSGAEAERADHMGANAFTVGRDVYFGSGGFRADTAAHELVHTVQQRAVEGGASVFVPMGSVQMQPKQINPAVLDKIKAICKYKSESASRFQSLCEKLDEFNPEAASDNQQENQLSALDWEKKRQELIHDTEEILKNPDEIEHAVDMADLLLELQMQDDAAFDNDMQAYTDWKKSTYLGSKEFESDRFLKENTPVFASVSVDGKGKEVVGSVYYGDEQGMEAARARLIHPLGPEICHYSQVFRYSCEEQKSSDQPVVSNDPELLERLNQLEDQDQLEKYKKDAKNDRLVRMIQPEQQELKAEIDKLKAKLGPDQQKQLEQLVLLAQQGQLTKTEQQAKTPEQKTEEPPEENQLEGSAQQGQSKETGQKPPEIEQKTEEQPEKLPEVQQKSPEKYQPEGSEQQGEPANPEQLIAALEQQLGQQEPGQLKKLLKQLENLALRSRLERDTRMIDYNHLENHKDRDIVEFVGSPNSKLHRHKSRGFPKAVGAVTGLTENGREDMISGVRYSMEIKKQFMEKAGKALQDSIEDDMNRFNNSKSQEERTMLRNSIIEKQYKLKIIELKAGTRSNNFFYAFMKKHDELSKISPNKQGFQPYKNYYGDSPQKKEGA